MIGVPGFIGFWSKFYIISGCLQSDFVLGALVFLTSSLLNVVYLLPIPLRALKRVEIKEEFKENYFCAIPLLITSIFTILIALFFIDYLKPMLNLIEVLYVK
jgi:multicomponent Na+:H+ antiporter subunit D